ncbi:LD-carboxypeptidase [Halobacillus locisalis]|uniref:LD-carboxypeptidase n=1 Tax=Halobacillus locisalis TaxID=220753 RepID=A0A838CQ80_9BACI|nr:LD-carboxypeptidase [Halobacillus locisalis]MBA2174150.1 LD-carboxypeptidase [Halobacillus locisalis]
MIKPNALRQGDQVVIIAPAGPPDRNQLMEGIEVLENVGLDVRLGRYVFDAEGFLAASDEKRLADLHNAFCDPLVQGVFCARGGYGTARIAPFIDYHMIHQNPKVFWGYSDITYLLNAFQMFSSLVTFHGPMIASDFNIGKRRKETIQSLTPLFTREPIIYDARHSPLKALRPGTGKGRLVGGNLTLLSDGVGTPFQIDTNGSILLLEDVSEKAYRIDAMLHHLKQGGMFECVQGVVLGDFQADYKERVLIDKVLADFFSHCSFPVVSGYQIGHCQPNYGIPLGTQATLTTSPPRLRIESGVL